MDGASIHGGNDGRSPKIIQTQSTVNMTAHSSSNGGSSQGVGVADNFRRMTNGDRADLRRSQGNEPMEPSDTSGTGNLGRASATSV